MGQDTRAFFGCIATVERDGERHAQRFADIDEVIAYCDRHGAVVVCISTPDITLTGGTTVDYDPTDLAEALRIAGCPEDRIDAVVKATVTFKVDRSVLRQLVAANPDYGAAADLAKREIEKPYRASAK